MFIGRKEELNFLEKAYKSQKAEFIIVYGRRRIGKTALISKFIEGKNFIFYSANNCSSESQLKEISVLLSHKFAECLKGSISFNSWTDFFEAVGKIKFKDKLILAIDEFPYLVNADKSLLSVLQNAWDRTLLAQNIMLIISGSSLSFIENEVLSYKNPLYGRATGIIKLKSLSFLESSEFFKNHSNEEKAQSFAILGGVPHYLSQFNSNLSLKENIIEKILDNSSLLYNETEFLLYQELRQPKVYNEIISTIALGETKLNSISTKTKIDERKLSTYLNTLVSLDIVEKEFPLKVDLEDIQSSKKAIYVIKDNFFRFYYCFCYKYKSLLENGSLELVYENFIKNELHKFSSKAFENICIEYLYKENKNNKLTSIYPKFSRWWGNVKKEDGTYKSQEIDILAEGASNNYLIAECKFRNSQFSYKQYLELKEKWSKASENYYYLFSLSGFDEKLVKESKVNKKLRLISLDNMLRI